MNKLFKLIKFTATVLFTMQINNSQAVQIGQDGLGQALIYPYYTVNNDLNTTYSIVNVTDQPKALRIRFLEGEIGRDVLSFNVYLSPYDVWTGFLVPTLSTLNGHVGEPSLFHATSDTSCAPFLIKSRQEFLPFVIDLEEANNNLTRAREGHIEVIEMGVLTEAAAQAVDHGGTGVPRDCISIEADWDDREWDSFEDLEDPSGGIIGAASIINVSQGITFSYDAIALENFWEQTGLHTDPGSELPNLSSAFPESRVLLSSGELAISEWSTGYEAVSAVLMKTEVFNEYGYDSIVNGKSEWVMNFPTKIYHTDVEEAPLAPFTNIWDGIEACERFNADIWDREEQIDIDFGCQVTCPPIDRRPKFCYSSNVLEIVAPGTTQTDSSQVLGSNNYYSFPGTSQGTENGWAAIYFDDEENVMIPVTGTGYNGLPVTGFMVQQFTNAAAQAGLLAQYGGLFMHKGLVLTNDDDS